MGELIDGRWVRTGFETVVVDGTVRRKPSIFRNWVTADGSAGPTGEAGFKAEAGRYHLYVSLACPWAHRTLILRQLKGLEPLVGLSAVHWHMGEDGWTFEDGPGVIADTVNGASFAHQLYTQADPGCTTRVSVPILWDKHRSTIVSNESSDIIRMFTTAFDAVGALPGDTYPEDLRAEIDAVNERVYPTLNDGVYKAGFATRQEAYEEAVAGVFATLDWLEEQLATRQFLVGDRLTEADIRVFTTLIRFDAVYHGHFKCNWRRLTDYPVLWAYVRRLYALPGFGETVDFHHIKHHYYESHPWLNPSRVVPSGPKTDWSEVPQA
jgi:putative glutathione S-transferase